MGIGKTRNNPCVCASGKKYKKCCWGKKANEIRYNHIHVRDNSQALCLTCREQSQAKSDLALKLAVKSAMPSASQHLASPAREEPEEKITAEL